MKYKIGDRVRIKSLDWYNENKTKYGNIKCGYMPFTSDMSIYCGAVLTICDVNEEFSYYHMKECKYDFTDEMIKGLVEEETQPKFKVGDRVITNKGYIGKFEGWVSDYQVRVLFEESGCNVVIHPKDLKLAEESDDFEKMYIESEKRYEEEYSKGEYCHKQSFKWGFQEGCDYAHENEKLEISLKDGYQFKDENGIVINATKIVLEKKRPKYPQTYEECCEIVKVEKKHTLEGEIIRKNNYKIDLLESFQKLLICRDAYWKIAGEEWGLKYPWHPKWDRTDIVHFIITYAAGAVYKDISIQLSYILAFPTEEMRDAFYEAFKELIESCKEFL